MLYFTSLWILYFIDTIGGFVPLRGFPGGSSGKESANTGDTGDLGSIPGSGRSPGGGNGSPLQCVLAWEILWTEEPGGIQSVGFQKSQT